MLGNELLADHVNRYPRRKDAQFYLNPKYTLELTLDVLADKDLGIALDADWDLPAGVSSVPDVFVGYLLLDAWIGNTDRHDNNWGSLSGHRPLGLYEHLRQHSIMPPRWGVNCWTRNEKTD